MAPTTSQVGPWVGLLLIACSMHAAYADRLPGAATVVTAVYPASDVLPENTIRFYVYFSAPMREGDFLKYVHLYDEEGNDLNGVFFDNVYELWDPTRQRLTILFDPGRVKIGLQAHERMGRALVPGRHYRLILDASWPDIHGRPLDSGFEKAFVVTAEDKGPPEWRQWEITAPEPGTLASVSIDLGEPLDHALLVAFLRIKNAEGVTIGGEIMLEDAETVWHLTPREKWQPGEYTLEIDPRLEDLAGNNLRGSFERRANNDYASALSIVNKTFTVN